MNRFGTPRGGLATPRTPRSDVRKESQAFGSRRKTRRSTKNRYSRRNTGRVDERSSRRGSLMDLGSSQRRNTRKSIARQHSIVVDSHHSAAAELNAAIEKRMVEWEERSRQTVSYAFSTFFLNWTPASYFPGSRLSPFTPRDPSKYPCLIV